MTTQNNQQVAQTILRQLGGNKFIAMTGSKNFVSNTKENSLTMKLTRNKLSASHLRIKLTANDDYTMEFFGRTGTIKKTIEGVYCDMLQDIFTEVTGLYTYL